MVSLLFQNCRKLSNPYMRCMLVFETVILFLCCSYCHFHLYLTLSLDWKWKDFSQTDACYAQLWKFFRNFHVANYLYAIHHTNKKFQEMSTLIELYISNTFTDKLHRKGNYLYDVLVQITMIHIIKVLFRI